MPDTEEDELIGAIVSDSTDLPNLAAETSERFFAEVMKLLEARAQSKWPNESDNALAAAFVHVDFPRKPFPNDDHELLRVLDLPISSDSIFGKLFFLSENADNGVCMEIPCGKNEILDWLDSAGFSDRPILIAYADTQKVSFRPDAHKRAKWASIRNEKPSLSIESLSQALSEFHEFNLLTPSMCDGTIWEPKRASEYVPAPNTERAIQRLLKTALQGWFRKLVRVETEDGIPTGRIDVRVLSALPDSQGLQYWAIIELKVARSFANAKKGKPLKAVPRASLVKEIAKGFKQADEFTGSRQIEEGFLEIYDMRKDKSDDLLADATILEAKQNCTQKVNCNMRPMYGSSDDKRDALGY